MIVRFIALSLVGATLSTAAPRYFSKVTSHYDRMLEVGVDRYGPRETGMWLSSVDIRNGGQFEPAPETSRRTYRKIHAPHGSTLYWDQPLVALAYWLSRRTATPEYKEAADAYIRDFLTYSYISESGYFLWGNHIFYDVFEDEIVRFTGGYHEMRPLPVAWEMFARIDADAAERAATAAVGGHLLDEQTGLFNRHAMLDGKPADAEPMPFLSAGGTLVETLAWLASRDSANADRLTNQAERVARYSHTRQKEEIGLVRVQPVVDRWDMHTATTEVGLWATSLLRAHELTDSEELRVRALDAIRRHLIFGFSPVEKRYWGMLSVDLGAPLSKRTTEYQPGKFSDVWEPLFPSHDHPMPFAEACLSLWEMTEEPRFRDCADDWVTHIHGSLPASYPKESITDEERQRGAFAESYGRVIHFLVRASEVLGDPQLKELAIEIGDDAVEQLWVEEAGMFRSHPGVDRADAVDGLGILFAALIYVDTGDDPDLLGFHF